MGAVETFSEHRSSLKRELKVMAGYTSDPKSLQAKQNQIEMCSGQLELLRDLYKAFTEFRDLQFKLEACSFFHGASLSEIQFFVARPLRSIEMDLREIIESNIVQVPEKLLPLIDEKKSAKAWVEHFERDLWKAEEKDVLHAEVQAEIKFSDKPVMRITELLQIAKGLKV